jgi:hypothetical protein
MASSELSTCGTREIGSKQMDFATACGTCQLFVTSSSWRPSDRRITALPHDFLKFFMQISGVVALEPKIQIKKTDENI